MFSGIGRAVLISVAVVLVLLAVYLVYHGYRMHLDSRYRAEIEQLFTEDPAANLPKIKAISSKIQTRRAGDGIILARAARIGGDIAGSVEALTEAAEMPGDHRTIAAVAEEYTDDMFATEDMMYLFHLFGETAEEQKKAQVAEIMKDARADSAGETAENALVLAREYTGDAQNAHDSAVNADLRRTLARIWDKSVDTRAEITQFMKLAPTVADVAGKIYYIPETVSSLGAREDDILAQVLARARDSRNARADIFGAVVAALEDSRTETGTVCANGRASRIIGALAGLDYDPEVGSIGTIDMWRNQALGDVKDAIKSCVERCKESPDRNVRAAAAEYTGGDEVTDSEREEFDRLLRECIDDTVDAYRDRLSREMIQKIKDECYIYAAV